MAAKKRSKILLLLELLLDGLLLLIFIPQALILGCLLAYGYIPVPSNWFNEQLSKIDLAGFRIQAERCELHLNGRIELNGLQIFSSDYDAPIFTAGNGYIHYELFEPKKPRVNITELILTSGTLYMPAVYAPNGEHSPLLERVAFDLSLDDGELFLESFCATLQDIRVRGSAHYPLNAASFDSSSSAAPKDGHLWLETTYKLISDALAKRPDYHYFKEPTVIFDLDVVSHSLFDLKTEIVCPRFEHQEASAENVIVEITAKVEDGDILFGEPTLVRARSLQTHRHDLRAESISIHITKDDWQQIVDNRWPEVELSAESITTSGIRMEAPYVKVSHNEEGIDFSGSTKGVLGGVEFNGLFNLSERSGWLDAGGSLSIYELVPDEMKEGLPRLEFSSAPYYNVSLSVGPGMELERLDFDSLINDVLIEGIDFEQIRARGYYNGDEFVISQLDIHRPEQWLEAVIRYRTADGALDSLLKGRVNPKDYNPLLPRWWASVFEDFDFTHAERQVDADFIIRANVEKGTVHDYYGNALLSNVAYRNVPLETGHIIVRGTPHYIEIHVIHADGIKGGLDGAIGFSVLHDGCPGPSAIHFDLATQLQPEALEDLMGNVLYDRTIGDFTFSEIPHAQLRGVYYHDYYEDLADKSHYIFNAISNGPVTYNGTPLDFLNLSGYADTRITQLREVTFGYAKGHGTAAADVSDTDDGTSMICLQINLQDADEQRAIASLPALDSIEESLKDQSDEPLTPDGREEGRIFANLHAIGPMQDLYAATGYGNLSIQDKELGSLQLLGPLSRILQGTSLGFTSFSLNTLESEFELNDREVQFSRVELNGERTRIEANGTMQMEDQELDMSVTVRLFGNMGSSSNPLKQLSKIVNPLAMLLKFQVTGTLEKQKFRSVYDPRNLLPF